MLSSQTSRRNRKIGFESGQSLAEFALALIFIILPFLMIFVETSVILYKYVALNNAAREGARAGSIYLYLGNPTGTDPRINPDDERCQEVLTTVTDSIGPLVAPPSLCDNTTNTNAPACGTGSTVTTCQISYGPSSAPFLDPVRSTDEMTVTLRHTHDFLFGALGNQIQLQARSSMRIEPSTVISP